MYAVVSADQQWDYCTMNDSVGPLSRALSREYNAYLHSGMKGNKALPKDS